jgi:hypothetical protein
MAPALLLQVPPPGIVEGGWDYGVAAYAITAAGFLIYAASVFARHRRSEEEEK